MKYGNTSSCIMPVTGRRKIYCFFNTFGRFLEEDMEEAFKRCRYHSKADPMCQPICLKNVSSTNFQASGIFRESFTRTAGKKSKISGSIESTG